MSSQKHDISMFFPAYNEEGNIASVIEDAQEVLRKHARNYEILIVLYEDSTDNTEQIVRRYMQKDENVRLVWQKKNDKGVGKAYRIGLKEAKYENIFYADSDNQFDLHDFVKFLPYMDNYDIIAGYKLKRNDPGPRLLISLTYNMIIRLVFNIPYRDVNTAFRLVKKQVLNSIKLHSIYGTVTTEMLVKAKRKGFKIKQIGVTHLARQSGKPLYEIAEGMLHPKTILNVAKELILVWWDVHNHY